MTLTLLLPLLLAGCLTETGTELELCRAGFLEDPGLVQGASVDGDTLSLDIGYGGGCADHYFQLCWDGTVAESDPAQISLWLAHEDNGDGCEAYFTETLEFDISTLRDSAPATLSIDGQTVDYE